MRARSRPRLRAQTAEDSPSRADERGEAGRLPARFVPRFPCSAKWRAPATGSRYWHTRSIALTRPHLEEQTRGAENLSLAIPDMASTFRVLGRNQSSESAKTSLSVRS